MRRTADDRRTAAFSATWPRMVRGDQRLIDHPDVILLGLAIAAGSGVTWFRTSASGVLQLDWLSRTFCTDQADILRGVAKLVRLGHMETAGFNVNDQIRVTLK